MADHCNRHSSIATKGWHDLTTIASIGTGNMGTALIQGILSADETITVRATTNSTASAKRLSGDLPRATVPSVEDDDEANLKAAAGADFVFLGVKPWMMADTLRGLAPGLEADTVLVSMAAGRSEEHTSELQSRFDLVCRLLLEKKKE